MGKETTSKSTKWNTQIITSLIAGIFLLISTLTPVLYKEFNKENTENSSDTPKAVYNDSVSGSNENYRSLTGVGSAIISYQCNEEVEQPCPPEMELKRRATEVAKIQAMNNICEEYASQIQSDTKSSFGKLQSEKKILTCQGRLKNPKIVKIEYENDIVKITVMSEITNSL